MSLNDGHCLKYSSELNQEKKNIPVTKEIIFVCQNYILFIDKCFQVGLISLISTMLLEDL